MIAQKYTVNYFHLLRQSPNSFTSSFHGTEVSYKFNTYKISTASDHELTCSENPFAIIILAARANHSVKNIGKSELRDLHLKDLKIALIKKVMKLNPDNNKFIDILYFILNYISFEFSETSAIFDDELAVLTKNTKVMGVVEELVKYEKILSFKEGKSKGKVEGKKELQKKQVLDLLSKKKLNDEQIAEFIQVPIKLVKSLRNSVN